MQLQPIGKTDDFEELLEQAAAETPAGPVCTDDRQKSEGGQLATASEPTPRAATGDVPGVEKLDGNLETTHANEEGTEKPECAGGRLETATNEEQTTPGDRFLAELPLFALPPSFQQERFVEQNSQFLVWWSETPENARALLGLLIAFFRIPDYSPQDLVTILLREIGRSICSCMEDLAASPQDIETTLRQWEAVLNEGPHKISLRIPAVGARTESSWMKSGQELGVVKTIYSWAVCNSRGVVYSAEIE